MDFMFLIIILLASIVNITVGVATAMGLNRSTTTFQRVATLIITGTMAINLVFAYVTFMKVWH